jgi:RND family efflux transporter MFP subunit
MRRLVLPSAALMLLMAPSTAENASAVELASAPAVSVARAEQGEIVETASVTGTLVPREEILVSPQVDGVAITQILVEEGDTVAAGQVLARLCSDALLASLAQNTAQIARDVAAIAEADASRTDADAAFGRTRDLIKTGAASRETYDTRQAALATADARVASAQADLAFARAQRQELAVKLADTEIKAPVAGVISRRVARVGSVVSMGGDPLFRIISDGAIELEADVPETTMAKLRPGQPATLDMAGGVTRSGSIRLVSPEMSRTSRLGRIRIAIGLPAKDGAAGGLVLGGFGRASVRTARHDGVMVPLSAVLFQSAGPQVQVVRDGVVETRPVTLGLRAEGRAEIVAGVQAGEAVISLSGTFVRGGDHVTAVESTDGQKGS